MVRSQRWISSLWAVALAASLPAGASAQTALLFENVTLIDGTGRPPIAGANVLVRDGRIARVGRERLEAAGAQRVDGSGRYLIPGLMDLHIHLAGRTQVTPEGLQRVEGDEQRGVRALHTYIYSGVTTVYDAGNDPDYIFPLRAKERSGEIVAPRLLATGGIVTYPGSHGSGYGSTLVDDWPEAIPLLDAHIARGPDMLKLTYEERGWGSRPTIPILPLDLLERIVRYYNEHGIRTTVHTSGETRAREAIFAGVDTLAHPIIQGPISEGFAKLMGAKKVPMLTTLTIGEGYSRLVEHPEFLDQPLYRDTFEPEEIARLKGPVREEWRERPWTWWMKIMTPIAQQNLKQIHDAGGVIAAGTDQSNGPALHRELELLVDAGFTPLEVIRVATLNGARFLGRENEMGSVEEGKIADLVLLGADPTADVNNLKRIEMVVKAGRIIDRSALDLPVNRR